MVQLLMSTSYLTSNSLTLNVSICFGFVVFINCQSIFHTEATRCRAIVNINKSLV